VEAAEPASQHPRSRKETSLHLALELVKSGEADAILSAGHTGAVVAGAATILETLPHVERPAVAALLPTLRGGRVTLVDAGANVEVRPLHLVQFGLLGEIYARRVLGIPKPKLGVLSNGEEPNKGTSLTRAALEGLAAIPGLDLRGYVEGKDLFTGSVDVIVTDGFTGNAVLKTAEGTGQAFGTFLRQRIEATALGKVGALLLRPALGELHRILDYAETGGAPLLGCNGAVVLAHGRSGPWAIRNAVREARDAASLDLGEEMSRACERASRLLADIGSVSQEP
jgi:glycerol-3-phosphate acyltransferase PlsX